MIIIKGKAMLKKLTINVLCTLSVLVSIIIIIIYYN